MQEYLYSSIHFQPILYPSIAFGLSSWVGGFSHSVVSNSWQAHGCSPPGSSVHGILQARRRVGCHFLLQGIFPTQGSNQDLLHCRQILFFSHMISLHVELRKTKDKKKKKNKRQTAQRYGEHLVIARGRSGWWTKGEGVKRYKLLTTYSLVLLLSQF